MRFKTAKYRLYEKETLAALPSKITIPKGSLGLYIYLWGTKKTWFTKSGSVRKTDVSNRIKALEDVLFRAINLDDSLVFEVHIFKCISHRGMTYADAYLTNNLTDVVSVPSSFPDAPVSVFQSSPHKPKHF